jgi:hypothetical protein
MTSSKTKKRSQPSVKYKLAEQSSELIDNAFDILFEVTLRQMDNLTTNDN